MLPDDRVSSPPPEPAHTPPSHRIGPFDITRDENEMALRLENRGELTIHGCLLFFFTMFCILVVGVLSVVTAAENTESSSVDASQFFAPSQNHLGFLWLVSSLLMFLVVPLYVIRTYRSALVFRFNRKENAFFRGKQRICRLNRIENVTLQEDKDPDQRYLYLLGISYDDGHQMLLFNGYEERETLNLANEMSSFLQVPTVWRTASQRP